MKPKNRIYCYACCRNKLLFETEKKANTFLKFNADTIEEENGQRPIRAYFCETCNGWHVTSQEKRSVNGKGHKCENIINAYKKDMEMSRKFISDHFKGEILGLFIQNKDKKRLFDIVQKYIDFNETDENIYLDYCELLSYTQLNHVNAFRILERYMEDKDKFEKISIIGIGKNDKCIAFKVKLNVPCANDVPYITIATLNNGNRYDSKYITNWVKFSEPINIKCYWKFI